MERLQAPQIFSAPKCGNALTTPTATIKNCLPDDALRYAAILLGCYRKVDCADPEVFATAAVAVLSRYPEHVARAVTDPQTGLPGTSKWVPTIAELREACETVNTAARRREESDNRVEAQLAERELIAAMTTGERRKEYVKRRMAEVDRAFAASKFETDVPPPPVDIRGMDEGPEKARLRRRLDGEISRLSERSASTPCAPLGSYAAHVVAERDIA